MLNGQTNVMVLTVILDSFIFAVIKAKKVSAESLFVQLLKCPLPRGWI